MDVNSKVEFLKFHQGYVRGVAFSPVVRIKLKYVLFDASVWNVNMLVWLFSTILAERYLYSVFCRHLNT